MKLLRLPLPHWPETPSTAFVQAMATFLSRHQTKIAGTRAAIVVRDDSGFGMGRMTELTDPAFVARTAGRRAGSGPEDS